MMSASEGGGGSWKSGHSKWGLREFYIINQFKMRTRRGGGQKIRKFCGHPIWKPLRGMEKEGQCLSSSFFFKHRNDLIWAMWGNGNAQLLRSTTLLLEWFLAN